MTHKALEDSAAGTMLRWMGCFPVRSCAARVSERWVHVMQIRVMCKSDGRFEKGADGASRYEGGETRLAQISASGRLASLKESLGRAFPVPPSLSPEVSHPASILQSDLELLPHTHSIAMEDLRAANLKFTWRKSFHVALRCQSWS